MKSITALVWACAVGFIDFAYCQTTSTAPGQCIAGSNVDPALPNCQDWTDSLDSCSVAANGQKTAFASCICQQAFFNKIEDCGIEQRECLGGDVLGAELSSAVVQWHSICDTRISFTPTTPVFSSLTLLEDPRCSSAIRVALTSFKLLQDQCSATVTASDDVTSCFCQTDLLSYAFTGQYVLEATCLRSPVDTSTLYGFSPLCPGYTTFFTSMLSKESAYSSRLYQPASTPASTTTTSSRSTGSTTTSRSAATTASETGSVNSAGITAMASSSGEIPPTLPGISTTAATTTSDAGEPLKKGRGWLMPVAFLVSVSVVGLNLLG